jgi:UDP-2-acetamido-3-amino-2,3-dideoxy-glucuronate N-acetyltransferase
MSIESFVSEKSKIGNNVKIGRFCIIEDEVQLGDNVAIGDYSLISSGTIISANTKMGTYTKMGKNVVIGSDCSFTSYCEIRDNCRIGNNVLMGSRCTLSAGTVVEDNVIVKYSFVATDTPDLDKNDVKAIVVLKKGSQFGANVMIMPGLVIGENSVIGACSQVRHNVPDNEIWYGSPAKYFKTKTIE